MSKPIRRALGPTLALLLLAGCDAATDATDHPAEHITSTSTVAADAAGQPNLLAGLNGPADPMPTSTPSVQARTDPNSAGAPTAADPAAGGGLPATTPPGAIAQGGAALPPGTTEAVSTTGPSDTVAPTVPPSTAPPATAPPATAAPTTAPSTTATVAPPGGDFQAAAAAEFLADLNDVRAGQGLGGLAVDNRLANSAAAQVDVMIANGGLSHQDLQDELALGWQIVGENVGYGPNVAAIHQALVNSPGHYANLVNTRYSHVGIAVKVDGNGRMWVAQVFGG